VTVKDAAREWAFGNLGRFAAEHAARFGEKPGETLRRAPRNKAGQMRQHRSG